MKPWLISTALVTGLLAAAGAAGPAAAADGAPPAIIDSSGTLRGFCEFRVAYSVTGQTKVIETGDERTIVTSPGQKITLTANGKSVTFTITGTRFERTEGNITEVEVTGQNILLNRINKTENPGIFYTVGSFDFALDAKGNEVRGFDTDDGKVTNVCELLS